MWRLAAGRELLRISASTTASREQVALLHRGQNQPGMTETSLVPELAVFCGTTFDEFVQWMVEDASLDR